MNKHLINLSNYKKDYMRDDDVIYMMIEQAIEYYNYKHDFNKPYVTFEILQKIIKDEYGYYIRIADMFDVVDSPDSEFKLFNGKIKL